MDKMSDQELIEIALNQWANHIETGNIVLSARDAFQAKKPFRALDEDQMELVLRLRRLAKTFGKEGLIRAPKK